MDVGLYWLTWFCYGLWQLCFQAYLVTPDAGCRCKDARSAYVMESSHGPLARYVQMRVAYAPGIPGTFSPSPRVSNPDMHHGTCVTHVPRCVPGSLTSGTLWCRWRGKLYRHTGRMRNPQFYVSGKRPMYQGDDDLAAITFKGILFAFCGLVHSSATPCDVNNIGPQWFRLCLIACTNPCWD